MHRFYVPTHQVSGDQAYLDGDQQRQIRNVLRLRPGDVIALFDGSGCEYLTQIESMAERKVTGRIIDIRHPQTEPDVRLTLVLSLLKGGRTELALQKCTEIGAAEFVVTRTQRSVPKVEEGRGTARLERWRAVVREAAEQSGRAHVPDVSGVLPFHEALKRVKALGKAFVAWELEKAGALLPAISKTAVAGGIALVVGPEGGFTEEEVAEAERSGAVPVSLGSRTLRAETAAIVGSALIVYGSSRSGGV